jgi:hypothetical protein
MTHSYVKLPNGTITSVTPGGKVNLKVNVSLDAFIGSSPGAVNSMLSNYAIGRDGLLDISYIITGHYGRCLQLSVEGTIDPTSLESFEYDLLPPTEFDVQVTRIGYGARTIRISAKTAADAYAMADDEAGSHFYDEHESAYKIEVTPA